MAEMVLDVVPEDPQEQQIASHVGQPSVEEHRREECEPHRLLGEGDMAAGSADTACVALVTSGSRLDLVDREGRSTDDLTRNGGVLESETDRLLHRAVGEEGLPGEERPQTDADDENGDDR